MADHQINAFDDTPTNSEPLICPFCGEKVHQGTYQQGFVVCKAEEGPEGEGDVFFLDNYQITKDPPKWFRDMQGKKSGAGCVLVFLAAAGILTFLGALCLSL